MFQKLLELSQDTIDASVWEPSSEDDREIGLILWNIPLGVEEISTRYFYWESFFFFRFFFFLQFLCVALVPLHELGILGQGGI